jgi:type I restriction enzyme S subunit
VMGKLVSPLPHTTSEEHLERKQYSHPGLKFQVPMHWDVKRLDQLSQTIVDCPHSTPKWTESGVICVRTSQFKAGSLDLSTSKFVSEETYQERIHRLEPKEDDILYSREGGILGIACHIPKGARLCLGQRMMLIRTHHGVLSKFIEMTLNSPLITSIARNLTTGGAAPRVNVSVVKAYPIPLPPLAEQHRIVAKVGQLMALCDQLKKG